MLEKLTGSGAGDAFGFLRPRARIQKRGPIDDAVATFSTLKGRDAGYLPM